MSNDELSVANRVAYELTWSWLHEYELNFECNSKQWKEVEWIFMSYFGVFFFFQSDLKNRPYNLAQLKWLR